MTLDHPIYRAMWDRHTGNVAIMADAYNRAEANRIQDNFEAQWARGESFVADGPEAWTGQLFSAPIPRDGDTKEEINAAADQLYELLLGVVIRGWVDSLSRETVVAILNQMDVITISICGRQLTEGDLRRHRRLCHRPEPGLRLGR